MTIKTDTVLSPTITQANLKTALSTALQNAGLGTPYDSYNSGGSEFLVFEQIYNGLTYGRGYLQVTITSGLVVSGRIFTSWNAVAHTGTDGGASTTSVTFLPGTIINFSAFKPDSGQEFGVVFATQGGVKLLLSMIRPATKASWYDESMWCFCFAFTSPTAITIVGAAITRLPFSGATNWGTDAGDPAVSNAAPDGKRDVIKGLFFNSPTGGTNSSVGKFGKCSDNLSYGATNGTTELSKIQVTVGVEEYWIISTGAGGFLIKV